MNKKNLNVRMPQEDYKKAVESAKKLGISLSDYIRMLIKKDKE